MIDKITKEFEKWVGYLEKKSNSQLDEFKANAGSNNYTCFSRDYKKFSGIDVQAQPWCDVFVDTIFCYCFGADNAKKMLYGFSAYTPTSAQYFKNNSAWFEEPQAGDVIFFKNSERINHTGFVYKVTNDTVYTIEGNTSSGSEVIANGGAVEKKSYKKTNSRIAGYGRPNYKIIESEDLNMKEYEELKSMISDLSGKISNIEKENNRQNEVLNDVGIDLEVLFNRNDVYQKIEEIPESYRPTIQKLINKGTIKGNENGLGINEAVCKTLVYMERGGILK